MRRALCLLLLFGCAGEESTSAEEDACISGQRWELGLLGAEEMSPGRPCLDCHGPDGSPTFSAAGTVFDAFDEADDCYGAAGVTVEIEDGTGKIVTAETNDAGNFFIEDEPLELPIIATVRRGGEVRLMPRFVHSRNCNDCHSVTGKLGAPGRVLAPDR